MFNNMHRRNGRDREGGIWGDGGVGVGWVLGIFRYIYVMLIYCTLYSSLYSISNYYLTYIN
jgi:hypothetical protein